MSQTQLISYRRHFSGDIGGPGVMRICSEITKEQTTRLHFPVLLNKLQITALSLSAPRVNTGSDEQPAFISLCVCFRI